MKPRNISFAQVLKNKPRSHPPEPRYTSTRLTDLLEMWQQSPQNDYTLYLGGSTIPSSQHSTSRILTSKNIKEGEEMFDSWIQRQSSILNNKDNKTTQSHRPNKNQQYKFSQTSAKADYNSKSKESNNGHKTIGELVRRNDNQHLENSSQYANLGNNIQMIKSKTCENDGRRQGLKSPNSRHTLQVPKLQVEEVTFKKQTKQQKANTAQERTKEGNKPKVSFKNVGESMSSKENINDIIADTANIHNQIADLAKKYLDYQDEQESNYIPGKAEPQEEQDEQLLIGNSDKKPVIQQRADQPMFSEGYSEKTRKIQELERMRKEEAKNKINNLMKGYFNKTRREGQPNPPKQVKLNILQEQQPIVQIVPNNLSVGYSFASNHAQNSIKFQLQHKVEHIPEVHQQMPRINTQMLNSQDLQFRKKYIRQENIIVPTQHIQNIQSVQYNNIQSSYRQEEAKVNQNIPNSSFQTKLIGFEHQRQKEQRNPCFMSNQYREYMIRQQQNSQLLDDVPQPHQKVTSFSKQIRIASRQQHSLVGEAKGVQTKSNKNSVVQQFGKFPHQKIKIVSSSKNKLSSNSNKSNKSSPAVSKSSDQKVTNHETAKQIKTEPFTPVQNIHNPTIKETGLIKSPQNTSKQQKEGCSPFKTIKEVKNSIVNPIKSPEPIQTKEPYKFETNLSKFQINHKQETYPTKFEPIKMKYETGSVRQKQTTAYTTNHVPPSYGKITKQQNNYNYYTTTQDNSSHLVYNNTSNYALPTQNSYNYQSSYVRGVQSNVYPTGSNMPSATYTQKLPSPKVYQLRQHYQTKYTTNFNSSYQTCQKFNSIIAKTQAQFPDNSSTIQSKMITQPTYQTRSSKIQNNGKRSYLSQLDIKQSINFDDKKKQPGQPLSKDIGNQMRVAAIDKKQETPSLLDRAMTNSLKKSINVSASGQFQFDF